MWLVCWRLFIRSSSPTTATLGKTLYCSCQSPSLVACFKNMNIAVPKRINNKQKRAGNHKDFMNLGEPLEPGGYILTITNGRSRMSIKLIKQ